MKREDRIRINHMLNACREVREFIQGLGFDEFSKNRMLILSTIKEIEIIGEAASKLSKEIMLEYDNIPWQDIIGMRNRLIHGYFDVDIKLVWNTLQFNLPSLLEQLKEIIH